MSPPAETVAWDALVHDPLSRAALRERGDEDRKRPLLDRAVEQAARLAFASESRAELVSRLAESLHAAGAPRASVESARRLADPRAVAVVTGQQPGFLGGPLLVLLKAAHAVALARELEARLGAPVIPLFWNHSDDHDLDETRSLSLVDAHGAVHRVAIDLGFGRPHLADVSLGPSASTAWAQVEPLLPAGPDRDHVIALFRPKERGRFADETTRILLELLGDEGLVVFEPRDLRAPLSRALADVVRDATGGLRRLAPVVGAIRSQGFEPPIPENDPPVVFARTPRGRERVHGKDGRFVLPDGSALTPAQLADRIHQAPDEFSAGVAARVAVEAMALPVAAVVRGPAELAYARSALAFLPESSRVEPPIAFPRFSATLLEPRIERALKAARVTARDVVESPESLASKTPKLDASPEENALAAIESDVASRLRELEPKLRELDVNLARPVEKTMRSAARAVASLRSKVLRARQDRVGASESRLRRIAASLRPLGAPQERVMPAAPFLCAGIAPVVRRIQQAVQLVPSAHALIRLDPEP